MDNIFMLFINDVPTENQSFVLELDEYLTSKGSKRTIKSAKSGFVTSYSNPKSGRALLNYVFRKTGVKVRIYAQNVGDYSDILSGFPDKMKMEIIKAGDCKKLNGLKCSPTCDGGYDFFMDGVEYKKCKNTAFFFSLKEENFDAINQLINAELE